MSAVRARCIAEVSDWKCHPSNRNSVFGMCLLQVEGRDFECDGKWTFLAFASDKTGQRLIGHCACHGGENIRLSQLHIITTVCAD